MARAIGNCCGATLLTVVEQQGDWSQGHTEKDGYQGYVRTADLEPFTAKTHWVSSLSSHAYAAPNLKSADQICLPFGAQVTVDSSQRSLL